MNGMDRQRFEELKEAYALDALSGEERREFELYLSENPSEQAEVDELSSVAALLALAPAEQEPSAGLRRILMEKVRSEAEAGGPVAGVGRKSRGGRVRRIFGARGVAVAAAAAAFVGLLVWNVSLQSEVRELRDFQVSAYELQNTGEAVSVQGKVMNLGEERAMLVATDLPELPEGQTYEMWTIDPGEEPEPCGLFEAGEGPAIETLQRSVSGAETFAITVEPEGGSPRPTGEIIVKADLTRRA